MSAAADFVDAALRYEATEGARRSPGELARYGTSVGAIRGTVRDALKRHPGLSHDDITALSSELWNEPVFERRLAAIVLLQTAAGTLTGQDLTRLEGFVRTAVDWTLVDPLTEDVIRPLLDGLDGVARARADGVIHRWATDGNPSLARAAGLLAG